MTDVDRFGKAIGIWHITVEGADLEIKPKVGDNRRLLRILMDESNKKDKAKLMEQAADYIVSLIKRDYPDPNLDETIKQYVEYNIIKLFEDMLIAFRWASKEDMDKAKKENMSEIKNLIGGN